ncbi:MAG TPA: alpha/beta fold hydrolase [archaeon]|nr:alpha/beta fold hydrolase [archaeon]
MKRAFLIHGWEGYPEEAWRPWLKTELLYQGFEVLIPAMPDTNQPRMDAWVQHLSEIVGTPDDECIFVGHSLGCIAILRYLETLKEGQIIGGVVMVAGFTDNLGHKELDSFFQTEINWEKIKRHCRKFVAIHSDNDPYVPATHGQIFKEKLNAAFIIQKGMKHFSGDDGITELPIVLDAVTKIVE